MDPFLYELSDCFKHIWRIARHPFYATDAETIKQVVYSVKKAAAAQNSLTSAVSKFIHAHEMEGMSLKELEVGAMTAMLADMRRMLEPSALCLAPAPAKPDYLDLSPPSATKGELVALKILMGRAEFSLFGVVDKLERLSVARVTKTSTKLKATVQARRMALEKTLAMAKTRHAYVLELETRELWTWQVDKLALVLNGEETIEDSATECDSD